MPYDNDSIYPFFCSRYGNITYNEYLQIGYEEFNLKLGSIPEGEPLFNIIKSRTVDLAKIKNKEERRYWRDLKRVNKIPDEYLPIEEIERDLKKQVGGMKDVK